MSIRLSDSRSFKPARGLLESSRFSIAGLFGLFAYAADYVLTTDDPPTTMHMLELVSDPSRVDVKTVVVALTPLGMKRYETALVDNGVDGAALVALSYDGLVTTLGFQEHHAEALVAMIARFSRLVALADGLAVKKALCKMEYSPQYVTELSLAGQTGLGQERDGAQLAALALANGEPARSPPP